jgi:hypothetical protein
MFPPCVLLHKIGEQQSYVREVLNVTPKEVAQPQKLLNLLDSMWRLSFLYSLQFVGARNNDIFGKSEA